MVSATIEHFFPVVFPVEATPKIDVVVPTFAVRFNSFFKVVKTTYFEEGTKYFVFVIVGKNARFVKSVEKRFWIDVIPICGIVVDAFNVLYKEFFVDAVKLKAFFFQFFNYFVPI